MSEKNKLKELKIKYDLFTRIKNLFNSTYFNKRNINNTLFSTLIFLISKFNVCPIL